MAAVRARGAAPRECPGPAPTARLPCGRARTERRRRAPRSGEQEPDARSPYAHARRAVAKWVYADNPGDDGRRFTQLLSALKAPLKQHIVTGQVKSRHETFGWIALAVDSVDLLEFLDDVKQREYQQALSIAYDAEVGLLRRPWEVLDATTQKQYWDGVRRVLDALTATPIILLTSPYELSRAPWSRIAAVPLHRRLYRQLPQTDDQLRYSVADQQPQQPDHTRALLEADIGGQRVIQADQLGWDDFGVQKNVAGSAEASAGHPPPPGNWSDSLPPSIPRTRADDLARGIDEALRGSRAKLIVVHGPAAAGKTRLVFDHLRDREELHVVVPHGRDQLLAAIATARRDAAMLATALDDGVSTVGTVVFLEDLERYAGDQNIEDRTARGLTSELFDAFEANERVAIVATAGGKSAYRLSSGRLALDDARDHSTGDPNPLLDTYHELLALARPTIDIEPDLDTAEENAALQIYRPEIVQLFKRDGPGRFFIAGPARTHHHRHTLDLEARAIVDAAIAWRRLGIPIHPNRTAAAPLEAAVADRGSLPPRPHRRGV